MKAIPTCSAARVKLVSQCGCTEACTDLQVKLLTRVYCSGDRGIWLSQACLKPDCESAGHVWQKLTVCRSAHHGLLDVGRSNGAEVGSVHLLLPRHRRCHLAECVGHHLPAYMGMMKCLTMQHQSMLRWQIYPRALTSKQMFSPCSAALVSGTISQSHSQVSCADLTVTV